MHIKSVHAFVLRIHIKSFTFKSKVVISLVRSSGNLCRGTMELNRK